MRTVALLLLATMICSCSLPSALVSSQTVSYDDAIEDITNKLLLLNILRAKDKAPLHFDEVPSIHESIQANASLLAGFPFGSEPAGKSITRNSISPGLSVQVAPTFEVDHLDTKDFATGIASPIDAKFVKYWLDRGLDRRIVLLLFFSAADITVSGQTIRVRNSPRDALDSLGQLRAILDQADVADALQCDSRSDFQHYLILINSLTSFSAHYFTERRLLADNLTLSSSSTFKDLESLASLDSSKYQWVRHQKDNTYALYGISSEPKTALCFMGAPIAAGATAGTNREACSKSVVEMSPDDIAGAAAPSTPLIPPPVGKPTAPSLYCNIFNSLLEAQTSDGQVNGKQISIELQLEIRSVGEIIQFLGDLLQYQEELERLAHSPVNAKLQLNNPLTFGYCPNALSGPQSEGCADIFFNLRHDSCNTRFSVAYRGRRYYVPNYNPPADGSCQNGERSVVESVPPKDHTLEVLSVVHQLIDLQKSAQDILQTPYVQVLP
jgi:hypothetical protein